jgi:hypothetical protein
MEFDETIALGLISKFNSADDFPGVHPDVVAAHRRHVSLQDERSHVDTFLKHVSKHFADQ